jgi:hypothetical protein
VCDEVQSVKLYVCVRIVNTMKPQSAKAKGRRLQQKVVADILEAFPSLTEDDVRSTSMGAGGEDVLLSSAAQELFPYSVEAKNQERVNVWSAIAQARANCHARTPLVVFKKNGEHPMAIVPWSHFVSLVTPPTSNAEPPSENDVPLSTRLRQLADSLDAQMQE